MTSEPGADPSRPLQGVRVLELGGDVGTRYVGRLFARYGAEVVRRGSSDDRRIGFGTAAGAMFGRWLDDSKHERDLKGAPDIVIAGQDRDSVVAGEEVARRLNETTLLALTWFDLAGPYADWPATDETILAPCPASRTASGRRRDRRPSLRATRRRSSPASLPSTPASRPYWHHPAGAPDAST